MINILVVDDDKDILMSTSELIKAKNYNVEIAESGEKALKIINKIKFDIVILDIQMSGIDGIEVLKKIKQKDQSIIVIIMTAFGTI